MKNVLKFNYNLEPEKIIKKNDDCYNFYVDYTNYYFTALTRTIEELEEIYELLSDVPNSFHAIIKNKDKKLVTVFNNKHFILQKIKGPENYEIDLLDIVLNQKTIQNLKSQNLLRNNWSKLWADKVDYLEYQMSELGKNHILAIKSFSYFIGLAENAISYFNNLNIKSSVITLAQKRISFPNINLNYNNPVNLIIDFRARDLAEYIRTAFYEGHNIMKEIELLLSKNILNESEYGLIYSRLLFPANYFDDLSKVLEKEENEEILIKYITNTKEYENFLKEIFLKFSKKASLIKIDWLFNYD